MVRSGLFLFGALLVLWGRALSAARERAACLLVVSHSLGHYWCFVRMSTSGASLRERQNSLLCCVFDEGGFPARFPPSISSRLTEQCICECMPQRQRGQDGTLDQWFSVSFIPWFQRRRFSFYLATCNAWCEACITRILLSSLRKHKKTRTKKGQAPLAEVVIASPEETKTVC